MSTTVTQSDWIKGISLSILASILGSASKLAIRKSWLLEASMRRNSSTWQRLASSSSTRAGQEIEGTTRQRPSSHRALIHRIFLLPRSPGRVVIEGDATGAPSGKLHLWKPKALRLSGMVGMSIFNPLCCVVAMSYASPSILAPFSGLTLVWIILLSDFMIQEPASPLQMISASLIVVGEVIISIYGDHTNGRGATIDDIVSLLH